MDKPETHWARGLTGGDVILEVVELFEDETLSYEFDITDAIRTVRGWYIVNTRGCSCPSYEEVASLETGPRATLPVAVHQWLGDRMTNPAATYYSKREAMSAMNALHEWLEENR